MQTTGPVIAAAWTQSAVLNEATLQPRSTPRGQPSTYRFEYGPTAAYGSETPELEVGSDSSTHEVTQFLVGLTPGATYHFRVVATNAVATNEGPDMTFTPFEPFSADTGCANQVFRTGLAINLADCRAYEMVSPIDKNGGDIGPIPNGGSVPSPTSSRRHPTADKIAYTARNGFGDELSSVRSPTSTIAGRGAEGWSTQGINAPTHGLARSPGEHARQPLPVASTTTSPAAGWSTTAPTRSPLMPSKASPTSTAATISPAASKP